MNMNKYAKKFLDELYIQIDKYYDNSKLNEKDKEIISRILGYEYGSLFYRFYNKDFKIKYNPELAINFNIFLTDIFLECVRMVFLCNEQIEKNKKEEVFKKLIQTFKNYELKDINLTESEIILKIKNYLRKEFKKIEHNINVDINTHRSMVVFFDNKYNLKYSLNKHYKNLTNEFNNIFPRNIFLIFLFSIIGLIVISDFHIKNNYLTVYFLLCGILMPIYCINTFKKINTQIEYLNKQDKIFRAFKHLGVDVIKLEISPELVCYAEKELDIMIPVISDLRLELTDEYGFIIPFVRILDNENLKNGIKFFIRGKEVDFLEINYQEVDFPTEAFKNKLKTIILNNIDKVFTIENALMMLELDVLINKRKNDVLEDKIDIYDIREILVKIIQKGGNLHDFLFIYERINHYLKITRNTDELAELIYKDIKKEV